MRILMAHGAVFAGLMLVMAVALGQTGGRPTWSDLSPAQREALAPLAKDWGTLDSDRKRKWLEVAAKYPNLSPEGKQKRHERMAEFSRLTPEQKKTARENFRRAYEVPAEQRQATIQKYQELPPDKKRELADRAAAKPDAPRRPATPNTTSRRHGRRPRPNPRRSEGSEAASYLTGQAINVDGGKVMS